MPVTLSELLADESLEVNSRRDVRRLYDAAKTAVAEGELTLEGHSLPASLNAWIGRVEGAAKLPKRDVDVVDFSFADDERLGRWREAQRPRLPQPKRSLSAAARDLLAALQALERANRASLGMTNGKKDEVLAALSDLQGAVHTFLDGYDAVQEALKLPERGLELANVRVRKRRRRS